MDTWGTILLRIISDSGKILKLQDIYRKLENGNYKKLSEKDLTPTRYGNRPVYQHQVRSHLSNLKQYEFLKNVSRGVYEITQIGRNRI